MTKRRFRWWLVTAAAALAAGGAAVAVWTQDDPELPARFWVREGGSGPGADALCERPDGDTIRTRWHRENVGEPGWTMVSRNEAAERPEPLAWLDEVIGRGPPPRSMNSFFNWSHVTPGWPAPRARRKAYLFWPKRAQASTVATIRVEDRPSGRWFECVTHLGVLADGEHRPADLVGRWSHPCTHETVDRVDVTLRADGAIVLVDGTPAGLWAADRDWLLIENSAPLRAFLVDGVFVLTADRREYRQGDVVDWVGGRRLE